MKNHFNKLYSVFVMVGVIGSLIFLSSCDVMQDMKKLIKPAKDTEEAEIMVLFSTNLGDIKIKMHTDSAPITVKNFLSYVNDGFYNGVIFHRVIPDFMIQTGGLTEDLKQKTTKPPIKNEADNGLKNKRGTVAMARTSETDSATSQFFVNVKDNPFLDHGARDFGYAVFGEVVEGMEVVDKIAALDTGPSGIFRDVPKTPVTIKSASVVKQ